MMEVDQETQWRQLADSLWTKPSSKPRKVRAEVVKQDVWDILEKDNFKFQSLLILESLQLLEMYLWPGYDELASNYHVILIALMATVKKREGLPVWSVFNANPEGFSSCFRRILSMSVDESLSTAIRNHLLAFLISAFQSLDTGIVRKECASLVSISIWHHLVDEQARERRFQQYGQLRKAWRAAGKRYDAGDDSTRARFQFERSWLFSMILSFVSCLYRPEKINSDTLLYCERFVEFLTDLESQLPTRRYVNALIQDLNLLSLIKLSPAFLDGDNGLFRDLFSLLRHFTGFPINDHTGAQYSRDEWHEIHYEKLSRLQRTSLKYFRSKLTLLALSNYGAIEQRSELECHLSQLTDDEIVHLCSALGYRTIYPTSVKLALNRDLFLEVLISTHERRKAFQEVVRDLNVLPTESDIYEPSLLRNESYDGSRSLAIPKLNLQYLTVGDFLFRSFILARCESFFEIRKDMEETIKRLQPSLTRSNTVQFAGLYKMALLISQPSILEVAPPKVGSDDPAYVRAEITLDVSKLTDHVRREWETLRPDDVVYLLCVKPEDESSIHLNGNSTDPRAHSGLQILRAAEVVQLLEDNGRIMRDVPMDQANGNGRRPQLRRLIVNIDSSAYKSDEDKKSKGGPDVYGSLNVLVRRKGRENNFKRILESIKSLTLSHTPVPEWLQEVFLGYGDPSGATYTQLPNRLTSLNLRDTFIDWQHLVESLPSKIIETSDKRSGGFGPPYVLEAVPDSKIDKNATKPSKKRRRDEKEQTQSTAPIVKVSTYRPPNYGPYVANLPKSNKTRFTPAQVEAITSGTQPGLTVIVGPPGTGKTDVATQIINNIYHDFPSQRTLMIAHSNQALNQLFQKITKLDIDQRHLLRLGHGEEDLETEVNYGKHGRVESFLDNRARFLGEVDRLADNFGAPGAHGSSCETAGYFKSVYVDPAWSQFWDLMGSSIVDANTIQTAFPFHRYFWDIPQPLFPSDVTKEVLLDIAKGCQRHIEKIFTELEDIRPFEILRNSRDKANYLLIKEARIIAMTSTHAAMRRQEIADLGFHYDNVIMEEAAQITEIENFIPLALQNPVDGKSPLQRVVLCGDHLQNSPIIPNLAFRQFANLEQSLFLRLIRLGVPVISLDQQGRARTNIADLYRWRYSNLGDLPNIQHSLDFKYANAGFQYDYQFINVPDYKGSGERQPTPHFIQNLGEAEYAVAIYQYMRLLGYPAAKISILTTYSGQRALIRDVLQLRCAKNRLFGLPRVVTTVDKYQGEQNDYVILSLTRTNRVGYLRDIRRLTVALSRARLGLYILGRREVFEYCFELKDAFERLLKRPDTLMLVPGELFPTSRGTGDKAETTEMTGLEHLGQYVYEMTQAKINQSVGGGQGNSNDPGKSDIPMIEDGVQVGTNEDEDDNMNPEEFDE